MSLLALTAAVAVLVRLYLFYSNFFSFQTPAFFVFVCTFISLLLVVQTAWAVFYLVFPTWRRQDSDLRYLLLGSTVVPAMVLIAYGEYLNDEAMRTLATISILVLHLVDIFLMLFIAAIWAAGRSERRSHASMFILVVLLTMASPFAFWMILFVTFVPEPW